MELPPVPVPVAVLSPPVWVLPPLFEVVSPTAPPKPPAPPAVVMVGLKVRVGLAVDEPPKPPAPPLPP
ncbi:MAG: hypothetical protein H6924_03750 [Alphaproteobacteria bacterium]|nr:hypothetical protein [Alphaproteobacteria bacterium]